MCIRDRSTRALDRLARVDAATELALFTDRARHAHAGVHALAIPTSLAGGTRHFGARILDAMTGHAGEARVAAKLTRPASAHARALVANLVGPAQAFAVVDLAVAVVIDVVAKLVTRRDDRATHAG